MSCEKALWHGPAAAYSHQGERNGCMVKTKDTGRHLTNSELALMEILWDAERPLGRPEILDKARREKEPPFAVNTFHVLINSLLEKEYIVSLGGSGRGPGNARRYAPTVTRNEYYALSITSSKKYTLNDLPDILAALLKFSKRDNLGNVLDSIENFVKQSRESRRPEVEEG